MLRSAFPRHASSCIRGDTHNLQAAILFAPGAQFKHRLEPFRISSCAGSHKFVIVSLRMSLVEDRWQSGVPSSRFGFVYRRNWNYLEFYAALCPHITRLR